MRKNANLGASMLAGIVPGMATAGALWLLTDLHPALRKNKKARAILMGLGGIGADIGFGKLLHDAYGYPGANNSGNRSTVRNTNSIFDTTPNNTSIFDTTPGSTWLAEPSARQQAGRAARTNGLFDIPIDSTLDLPTDSILDLKTDSILDL